MCLIPITDCTVFTDLSLISWKEKAFIQHVYYENAISALPWDVLCILRVHKNRAISCWPQVFVAPSIHSFYDLVFSTLKSHLLWYDTECRNIRVNICKHSCMQAGMFFTFSLVSILSFSRGVLFSPCDVAEFRGPSATFFQKTSVEVHCLYVCV